MADIEPTFAQIAEDFLKAVTSELDPYTTENGVIEVNEEASTATLFTPAHIQFAKYGRGPGKQPPVDEIHAWVSKKRFQFRKPNGRFMSYESTAWAIAKSIAKKGTSNYVPNAPNAIEEAFNLHIKTYYEDLNRELFGLFAAEVNSAMEKGFNRKIKYEF